MQTASLYRIGVISTKGGDRRYVSGTAERIELSGRRDALHWNKRVAMILASAFNTEFAQSGRPERFQIERSAWRIYGSLSGLSLHAPSMPEHGR